MSETAAIDPDLAAFAAEQGLVREGETARWTPLAGGVSSDIWRLDAGGRSVCVKRALAKLKVKDDWRAPIGRCTPPSAAAGTAARSPPEIRVNQLRQVARCHPRG